MEIFYQITLSVKTLLACSILPFLYFGLHAKYWYSPNRLRNIDIMLVLVASLSAAAIVISMTAPGRSAEGIDAMLLAFAHLCPLALTFLIVAEGRRRPKVTHTHQNPNSTSDETSYMPAPISATEHLTWDDLIVSHDLKRELDTVVRLLHDPQSAAQYGIEAPKGILFQGPPGTGKTTIAKVMANVAGLSFFVLRSDDIVSKWVGESEKNLSKLFLAAQKHAPSIIFIDEIDSIGKTRASDGQRFNDNLLNHLLQLVDGVVKAQGIYIIGATNRADLVDSALKRPGRLNKVIEIPLPDMNARAELFRLYLSKLTLEAEINYFFLAKMTQGCSGATIKEICNQAGLNAFQRESAGSKKDRQYQVTHNDLITALEQFAPTSLQQGELPSGAYGS